LAPAFSSASKMAATARWVDDHRLALELTQRALELRALVQANAIAEMLADIGTDLLARNKQVSGAVGVHNRIGQGDGRVSHVLAANIERPSD
jgi:hypothetical protein